MIMQKGELRPSALTEIRNVNGPATPREWETTKGFLDLQDYDSEGKVILDLGSGLRASSPDSAFPGARVYAVDPLFSIDGRQPYADSLSKAQLKSYQEAGLPVSIDHRLNLSHERRIGVSQRIPYPANTFDLVMSTFSFPMYVEDEDLGKCFSEVVRVTKPGGEVRLWPSVGKMDRSPTFEKTLEILERVGLIPEDGKLEMLSIKVPEIAVQEKNNLWKKLYRELRVAGLIAVTVHMQSTEAALLEPTKT